MNSDISSELKLDYDVVETPNDTFCLSPGYRWNSWRGGTVAFDYRSPLGVTATQSNQPGVTTIHLPDLPRGLPQNSSLYFFCTKKEGAEIKSFAPFSLFNTKDVARSSLYFCKFYRLFIATSKFISKILFSLWFRSIYHLKMFFLFLSCYEVVNNSNLFDRAFKFC